MSQHKKSENHHRICDFVQNSRTPIHDWWCEDTHHTRKCHMYIMAGVSDLGGAHETVLRKRGATPHVRYTSKFA